MQLAGRVLLIILLITLVISGLNITNDSINQLTGENRKAVIAVNTGDENIYLQLLGEEYSCSDEQIENISETVGNLIERIWEYLLKIWEIVDTLLL